MKKFGIFALVLTLTGLLCACNRGDANTHETTGNTMPTVITTIPMVEDMVPDTNFQPDQDGFIGDTEGNEATDNTTDTTETSRRTDRLRLR